MSHWRFTKALWQISCVFIRKGRHSFTSLDILYFIRRNKNNNKKAMGITKEIRHTAAKLVNAGRFAVCSAVSQGLSLSHTLSLSNFDYILVFPLLCIFVKRWNHQNLSCPRKIGGVKLWLSLFLIPKGSYFPSFGTN